MYINKKQIFRRFRFESSLLICWTLSEFLAVVPVEINQLRFQHVFGLQAESHNLVSRCHQKPFILTGPASWMPFGSCLVWVNLGFMLETGLKTHTQSLAFSHQNPISFWVITFPLDNEQTWRLSLVTVLLNSIKLLKWQMPWSPPLVTGKREAATFYCWNGWLGFLIWHMDSKLWWQFASEVSLLFKPKERKGNWLWWRGQIVRWQLDKANTLFGLKAARREQVPALACGRSASTCTQKPDPRPR